MPKDFERCYKSGGKVVTKKLSGGRYIHLCKDSKGWHSGEVKKKKSSRKSRRK